MKSYHQLYKQILVVVMHSVNHSMIIVKQLLNV